VYPILLRFILISAGSLSCLSDRRVFWYSSPVHKQAHNTNILIVCSELCHELYLSYRYIPWISWFTRHAKNDRHTFTLTKYIEIVLWAINSDKNTVFIYCTWSLQMPDLQLLVWGKMANKTLRTIQAAKIVSFTNIITIQPHTFYQSAYETFQMYGTYFKILKNSITSTKLNRYILLS
jgi:hypothetical protein